MKIKISQIFIIIAVIIVGLFVWRNFSRRTAEKETIKVVSAQIGDIQTVVSTTGKVYPKNRLEIKPPVNGRIDQMLVEEGKEVNVGDIVAWMSSTDRAALLDSARGQGEETLKYWQEVYKPIPLIAPIDGEVIVGTTQPGQTVTTSDPIIVLSDRLIVRAQVDETDIGNIKLGQKAIVTLDAYTDVKLNGVVDHIYYESKTVSNVTMYEVDLQLESIPDFFRSGMNTNIDFIQNSKQGILLLPLDVIQKEGGKSFVMMKSDKSDKPIQREVVLGIADDKNVEIVSGLTQEDEVISKSKKYSAPKSGAGGTNPFMPQRRNQR